MLVHVMSYALDCPPTTDGQPVTTHHRFELPRHDAVRVARAFYAGDGGTAVHDETWAAFTPEERAAVEESPG